MTEQEKIEALKWLQEKKFTLEDGKWRKSLDTVSIDKKDFEKFKAEGKKYMGDVVQSLELTVGLVRLSSGLEGFQCAVAAKRKSGSVFASVAEVPEKAYYTPKAAIKSACQLLFMEIWHVVKQVAKYAKFDVEYGNNTEDED